MKTVVTKTKRDTVYAVVDVCSGCVSDVYVFRHREDAHACLEQLRRGRNLEYDDMQIVETVIDGLGGGDA